jgi:hypothetical protein
MPLIAQARLGARPSEPARDYLANPESDKDSDSRRRAGLCWASRSLRMVRVQQGRLEPASGAEGAVDIDLGKHLITRDRLR